MPSIRQATVKALGFLNINECQSKIIGCTPNRSGSESLGKKALKPLPKWISLLWKKRWKWHYPDNEKKCQGGRIGSYGARLDIAGDAKASLLEEVIQKKPKQ